MFFCFMLYEKLFYQPENCILSLRIYILSLRIYIPKLRIYIRRLRIQFSLDGKKEKHNKPGYSPARQPVFKK